MEYDPAFFSEEDRKKLIEDVYISRTKTAGQMVSELGIPRPTFYLWKRKYVQKYGQSFKPLRTIPLRSRTPQAIRDRAVEELSRGASTRELAGRYGVKPETVREWQLRHEFTMKAHAEGFR